MEPIPFSPTLSRSFSAELRTAELSPTLEPVKLGIVGCGGHACDGHLLPITQGRLAVVTALFDPRTAAVEYAQSVLQGAHPALETSMTDLWRSAVEAVLIASPDHLHCAALEEAVANGKHVFIEKPLATNSAELDRVAAALGRAAAQGLIVSSCHPRRYDPPFMWLKRSLPGLKQSLGSLLTFDFDFSYHAPTETWKLERSLLLDHATHEIDLLNYLCGVSPADAARLADGFDYYRVYGLRSDGIAFTFSGTRRLPTRDFIERLQLRFDRGLVTLLPGQGTAEIWNHAENSRQTAACGATDYQLRGKGVTENFLLAIRGVEESYLTYKDLLFNTSFAVQLAEKGEWNSASGSALP